MKIKSFLMSVFTLSMMLTACSDDDNINIDGGDTGEEETVTGEVSGIWERNSTINVDGHLTIPQGKSLTIEEGVKIIVNTDGVGVNHTPIEIIVDGSLYCKGTEENPILFSIPEAERTSTNTFKGLWGGIVATNNCPEMLINHTVIEYTGGEVLTDSPSALKEIYTPGDDNVPQITTNNVNGQYVIINSTLRNGVSDAIYMMGGKGIIANNLFVANGETGGEAINVKAGCKVEAAFNVIYSPNTNGLKLSSSGQNDEAGRYQALINAYNNTIINAGWRRDGTKGGSAYIEKNALVNVFNNLMVNCKFKAMVPSWGTPAPDAGCDNNSIINYNYYASGSQQSSLTQDIENGTITAYAGYTLKNKNYNDAIDQNSIISAFAGDDATNPKFINFPYNTNELNSYTYDNSWNFHVTADSPVLSGACSDFSGKTFFNTNGLTINGQSYTTPTPQARFGAYGTN
ncbi:hypothetical protein [Parabacteroides sp. AM08-6]|uniref:hypothetical protein n=1 Tax=Parabacteroides sp. AM08-6 TaxID=2292053 RepID=UPI000EFDE125|nr:hypothetical protein [Parabacteroides sp. AM08-6]RHJ82733.1 hypothetical protein DW103_09110 [Parabacteroides sp. AM08-6]